VPVGDRDGGDDRGAVRAAPTDRIGAVAVTLPMRGTGLARRGDLDPVDPHRLRVRRSGCVRHGAGRLSPGA
jgi:hypothetical protein